MSFHFVDRVEAARHRPRPVFKLFRTRLIMNDDARRVFFPETNRLLLGFDAAANKIGIKVLPSDVYEHADWQAFHIIPRVGAEGLFEVEWRQFWDREVGRTGGRPLIRGVESISRQGEDVLTVEL